MNRAATIAHLERCRRIAEGREDITDEERTQFPTLKAREMARAEARRKPEPQLVLPEVA